MLSGDQRQCRGLLGFARGGSSTPDDINDGYRYSPLATGYWHLLCLPRHGDAEPVAQSLSDRPSTGVEGHVPVSGSQGNLYRAISHGAAAGGGALPRGAAAERES